MTDIELELKKHLAVRRAEQRLRNRLRDLTWEHEVLKPELEALKQAVAQGELPVAELVDEDS